MLARRDDAAEAGGAPALGDDQLPRAAIQLRDERAVDVAREGQHGGLLRNLRLRRQREAGAARNDTAQRLLDREANPGEARLRRVVRVVEARLPAGQRLLVHRVEE